MIKLNLTLRSFWAAGLIVVKPRMSRMDMPHLAGGNNPYEDISFVAAEVSQAFTKLNTLMQSTRGKWLMAIHRSGEVITGGPLQPAPASRSPPQRMYVTTCGQPSSPRLPLAKRTTGLQRDRQGEGVQTTASKGFSPTSGKVVEEGRSQLWILEEGRTAW